MIFNNLPVEKVNSVHHLLIVLRLLKVTGKVLTKTARISLTEFGRPYRYNMYFEGYDPSLKGILSPLEQSKFIPLKLK